MVRLAPGYPKWGLNVRTYAILIRDARYSVPSLVLADVAAHAQIAELVRKKLEESPHHLAIEVLDGDTLVLRVARDGAE